MSNAVCVALASLGFFVASTDAPAQSGGSDDIQVKELKAALSLAQERNRALREQLERSEAQRKALAEKLAEAVRISEEQMAQSREIEKKLQAFGVDLFTRDEQSLEQRLLRSVRDLDIAEKELERRKDQIRKLSESYLEFINATPGVDSDLKGRAMAAIDEAGDALSPIASGEVAEDVSDSRVVSLDPEIGLVVFNAGHATGLRVGTPVSILRKDTPIFSALVVDVRESISGAVLQDRLSEGVEVAVGDGVRLLPNELNL